MAILRSLTVAACVGLGGLGLVGFGLFLWRGAMDVLPLGLPVIAVLLWNTAISLAFFAQHSGMIRTRSRQWLTRFIPGEWFGLSYAAMSGLVLIGFVLLWQPSDVVLYAAQGSTRWALRGLFLAAGIGMLWGARALQSFDLLGLQALSPRTPVDPETGLQIRGPYRWVRHPMYSLSLVMIWSFPDGSLDRCLFNLLWTGWIIFGARLEERDLVTEFGDAYRTYQQSVPMLIPRYIRPDGSAVP